MKRLMINHSNQDKIMAQAAEALKQDQLVVYPSDTVYGIAANALSQKAVRALLAFKERQRGKAISIVVAGMAMLEEYVSVSDQVRSILSTLLPGPFTVVLPSQHRVVKELEAEDGSLGVRIPDSPFIKALSATYNGPFTATSANVAGHGPHYSIDALLHTLSEKKKGMIGLIIDAGELPHNEPSTVLNLQSDTIATLRSGSYELKSIGTFVSHSPEETQSIGQKIIQLHQNRLHKEPLVLLLQGDLGVGKTVFAQGVGAVLGVTQRIVSPTYVLYYEYDAHHPLVKKFHHFDLYRAQSQDDLQLLGLKQILIPRSVLVIEWGERVGSVQEMFKNRPATMLLITITEQDEDRRLQVYELVWS